MLCSVTTLRLVYVVLCMLVLCTLRLVLCTLQLVLSSVMYAAAGVMYAAAGVMYAKASEAAFVYFCSDCSHNRTFECRPNIYRYPAARDKYFPTKEE